MDGLCPSSLKANSVFEGILALKMILCNDPFSLNLVRKTTSSEELKNMVVPMDTNVEERWLRYAREIGLAVLLAKVRHCSETVRVLLNTYTDGIVYLDPLDGLWGIQSTLVQEGD